MTLPEMIRTIRKNYNLTQTEMADRLGVTLMAVSRWERGERRPDGPALSALLLVFPEYQQDILGAMVMPVER